MKNGDFLILLESVHSDLLRLSKTKGKEYANSDDQLANFKRLASVLNLSPEAVCTVYLTKHLDSIFHFVSKSGQGQMVTTSEPIRGRVVDAILYMHLLLALIEERGWPTEEGKP